MLADAVTLIGHASYLASLQRREFLKPGISSAYQSVCSKSNPVTAFLFDDELPKHIKDIGEVNNISRKTLARVGTTGRYIPEYQSNYNQQFGRQRKERAFFRIRRLQQTSVPGSEGKQCSNFSQEFQGSDRQGLNQVPKAYAGNLQYHIGNWRKLTSDPWVLETVTGYHLKFDSIAKQTGIPKPPPFGGFEKQLIDDEIVTLRSNGYYSFK